MLEQVGPQKLLDELKSQAPRYAKLLPELPRLLHDYLRKGQAHDRQALDVLITEQRRTNRLLQAIIYGGIGFALGLIAMQVLLRIRL
jgi:ubiquinone biosynthesis protein